MKMLYALRGKTLSAQEIITETGEKLLMSTVTRDLYNMREAHILYVEYRGNRRYYSINYDTLDLLISQPGLPAPRSKRPARRIP